MPLIESVEKFAKTIYEVAKSDRDVTLGCGGFSGEGKSVFLIHLCKAYSKLSNTKWTFKNNMTWSRDELFKWIDGEGEQHTGRKPEYTAINADEFVSMFFNRNWYEEKQIQAIEKLNKCRDRHLFIAGCIPVFWQLDTGLISRIRFYVYVPRGRGRAWVFQQEDNPFSKDAWNTAQNLKDFRKKRNPYSLPNFVCEIQFDDLDLKEKEEYLEVRNTRRLNTELQNTRDSRERYSKIKRQRDSLIREMFDVRPDLKYNDISEVMDETLSVEAIRMINEGQR